MNIDPTNEKHIIADEGKLLKQKSSNVIFGTDVFLGTVIIDGELVEDTIDNFEEIDMPDDNNNNHENMQEEE